MNLYKTPSSDIDVRNRTDKKRWDLILAFRLLSKSYLVFLFILIFLGVWYESYISMIDYMQQQGTNIEAIGRINVLKQMFGFGFIPGSMAVLFVSGLLPVGLLSYFQSKKSAYLFQFLWALTVVALFILMFHSNA